MAEKKVTFEFAHVGINAQSPEEGAHEGLFYGCVRLSRLP